MLQMHQSLFLYSRLLDPEILWLKLMFTISHQKVLSLTSSVRHSSGLPIKADFFCFSLCIHFTCLTYFSFFYVVLICKILLNTWWISLGVTINNNIDTTFEKNIYLQGSYLLTWPMWLINLVVLHSIEGNWGYFHSIEGSCAT